MKVKVIASGSDGNAYTISDGETALLLDAGVRGRQMFGALGGLPELHGCLVTHEHKDHAKGAAELARMGIDVYMSGGSAGALGMSGHRVKIVKALRQFRLGSFTVLPFDVQHDAAEPLGFLLASDNGEKLLYFTDTYYVKYRFTGLTHIIAECNYSVPAMEKSVAGGRLSEALARRIIKSHMSLEHLLELLKANDLRRLAAVYLAHMSNTNGDEAAMAEAVRRATGAAVYVC